VEGTNQVLIADEIIASVLPLLAEEAGAGTPAPPPTVSALTTTSAEAYRHYINGTLAREENRTPDALRELNQAVALDSTFALALFELSRAQNLDLDRDVAASFADRAWEWRARLGIKDRMRLEAWRVHVDNRDVDAIGTFEEMLSRWPDDRQVLRDLSDILHFNWQFNQAETVAGQGLALYPDDEPLAVTYGTCLALTGRSREALAIARRNATQHPESPNLWDELGLRYLETGLPDSAEAAFQSALAIEPDFFWSRLGLGYCEYARGDVAAAIDVFDTMLSTSDLSSADRVSIVTDMSFWPGTALLYAESGRFEKALELFNTAWSQSEDPGAAREFEGRVQLLLRMDRPRDALVSARTLLERAKSDYDRLSAKHYEARSLVALDSLTAATAAAVELRTMIAESGRVDPYLLSRVSADIALANGDPALAVTELEEMLRQGVPPGGLKDIERRESLAKACRLSGDLKKAADVCEEMLKIYKSHALAHYDLALIYEEMNELDKAAEHHELFLTKWSLADAGLPQLTDARARLLKIQETSR
jgi:tetratricopeptide (TPR) repeat protein